MPPKKVTEPKKVAKKTVKTTKDKPKPSTKKGKKKEESDEEFSESESDEDEEESENEEELEVKEDLDDEDPDYYDDDEEAVDELEQQEVKEFNTSTTQAIKLERVILRGNDRKTMPVMNKYEETRVIAFRAEAIQNGALPLVNTVPGMTYEEIATKELIEKKCPLVIFRPMPYYQPGKQFFEEWKVSELTYYYDVKINDYL